MEHKEMIALLKSQIHMTYAERNEIAVQLNALAERLRQQDAEIEKLVQERGTMKASSPTMEWISMEDELPELFEKVLVYTKREGVEVTWYTDSGYLAQRWKNGEISYWMPLPEQPKPKEPTFKDVFLKAFPKADIEDGDDGLSPVCRNAVFLGKSLCSQFPKCSECWNQPYFEEEGGE